MGVRLRNEEGFLLIELIAAVVILSVALLALLGAYDEAWFSLRSGAKDSSAGMIANNQLELYASLQYSSIGLDATTLTSTKASDTTYASDEAALPGTGTDATISGCGGSAQCLPVQTVTGADGKSYRLETFIRTIPNPAASAWKEKVVTVIVRDPSKTGSPKVVTLQTAFDQGPSS
jgi:Tfp pilus assembly protein PilV